MRKIVTYIVSLSFIFLLCGCSNKNEAYISDFTSAFNKTLQLDNATIEGNFFTKSNDSENEFDFSLEFNQKNELEAAASIDLVAGKQRQDDFLNFYLKDGKTYLNNMGTKSQSLAKNLGIQNDSKLDKLNPFLNYTNDEISSFFTSTSKNGDEYKFQLNPDKVSVLLDSYGTVSVNKAELTCRISDGILVQLDLSLEGEQNLDEHHVDSAIKIKADVKKIGATKIDFPEDLNEYPND